MVDNRLRRLLVPVLLVSMVLVAVLVIRGESVPRHCLGPLEASVTELCFNSQAEVFSYVTNGELQLAPDASAAEIKIAYDQWLSEQQPESTAEILPLPVSP